MSATLATISLTLNLRGMLPQFLMSGAKLRTVIIVTTIGNQILSMSLTCGALSVMLLYVLLRLSVPFQHERTLLPQLDLFLIKRVRNSIVRTSTRQ
jgi:hypothetical protein